MRENGPDMLFEPAIIYVKVGAVGIIGGMGRASGNKLSSFGAKMNPAWIHNQGTAGYFLPAAEGIGIALAGTYGQLNADPSRNGRGGGAGSIDDRSWGNP